MIPAVPSACSGIAIGFPVATPQVQAEAHASGQYREDGNLVWFRHGSRDIPCKQEISAAVINFGCLIERSFHGRTNYQT